MKKLLGLFLLALAAAPGAGLPASHLSLPADLSVDVVIHFHSPVGRAHRELVRWHGGVIHRELTLGNGIACRIPRSALSSVSAAQAVKDVSFNAPWQDAAIQGD